MNRINAFTSLFDDFDNSDQKEKPKKGKPGDKLRRKAAENRLGMTYGRTGLFGLPALASKTRRKK